MGSTSFWPPQLAASAVEAAAAAGVAHTTGAASAWAGTTCAMGGRVALPCECGTLFGSDQSSKRGGALLIYDLESYRCLAKDVVTGFVPVAREVRLTSVGPSPVRGVALSGSLIGHCNYCMALYYSYLSEKEVTGTQTAQGRFSMAGYYALRAERS